MKWNNIILIPLFCILIFSTAYSQESFLNKEEWYVNFDNYMESNGLLVIDDKAYKAHWYLGELEEYNSSIINLDEYGFYTADFGAEHYYLFYSDYGFQHAVEIPKEQGNWVYEEIKKDQSWDLNILSISSSSFLSETIDGKKINYDVNNFLLRFFDGPTGSVFYNYPALPWVEGVEGNGIGEKIEITFNDDFQGISILGGFVDIVRPYLFRANSRPRQIKITSVSDESPFEMFVNFHDSVQYTDVIFPKKTNHIVIEIIEVYDGEKWQDTCISTIFPLWDDHQNNLETYKKYLQKIKNGEPAIAF